MNTLRKYISCPYCDTRIEIEIDLPIDTEAKDCVMARCNAETASCGRYFAVHIVWDCLIETRKIEGEQ